MSEKYERQYWSKKFGVHGVSLAAAVKAAGNGVDALKEYFKDKRKAAAKKVASTKKIATKKKVGPKKTAKKR